MRAFTKGEDIPSSLLPRNRDAHPRSSSNPCPCCEQPVRDAGRLSVFAQSHRSAASENRNVIEPGHGDDLVALDQDAGSVAADAEAGRVVDVDFA